MGRHCKCFAYGHASKEFKLVHTAHRRRRELMMTREFLMYAIRYARIWTSGSPSQISNLSLRLSTPKTQARFIVLLSTDHFPSLHRTQHTGARTSTLRAWSWPLDNDDSSARASLAPKQPLSPYLEETCVFVLFPKRDPTHATHTTVQHLSLGQPTHGGAYKRLRHPEGDAHGAGTQGHRW